MYFLLTIFMTFTAIAQSIVCDESQMVKECHAALCSPNAAIPTTQKELDDLRKKEKIPPSEIFAQEKQDYLKTIQATAAQLKRELAGSTPQSMIDDLLKDPVAGVDQFRTLLSGKVKAIEDRVIVSNMTGPDKKTYDDAAKIVSKWKDLSKFYMPMKYWADNKSEIYIENDADTVRALKMVDGMIRLNATSPENLATLQKIRQAVVNGGTIDQNDFSKIFSPEKFSAMLAAELSADRIVMEKVASLALDLARKTDWDEKAQTAITTCDIVDYLESKNFNDSSNFDAIISKTIQQARAKFLPMLSDHTRKFIEPKLKKEIFEKMVGKPSMSPGISNFIAPANSLYGRYAFLSTAGLSSCGPSHLMGDYAAKDKIYISPMTMTFGMNSVLNHELGHFVSYLFTSSEVSAASKQSFLNLRQCISGLHDENPAVDGKDSLRIVHAGDKQFSEEDFGDWFAATTNPLAQGFSCDLLLLFRENPPASYEREKRDTHSNQLFREMHMRSVESRAVPQVCRELAASKGDTPKKCEMK